MPLRALMLMIYPLPLGFGKASEQVSKYCRDQHKLPAGLPCQSIANSSQTAPSAVRFLNSPARQFDCQRYCIIYVFAV